MKRYDTPALPRDPWSGGIYSTPSASSGKGLPAWPQSASADVYQPVRTPAPLTPAAALPPPAASAFNAAQPMRSAPPPASQRGDGLAGRSIDIPYKSDQCGEFPAWLQSRMSPEEFRSVHRRLRSAYMKGRVSALYVTGMIAALTCSLATPCAVVATKGKVQTERMKAVQVLSDELANRGIRFEVSSRSPVSIRMVLS